VKRGNGKLSVVDATITPFKYRNILPFRLKVKAMCMLVRLSNTVEVCVDQEIDEESNHNSCTKAGLGEADEDRLMEIEKALLLQLGAKVNMWLVLRLPFAVVDTHISIVTALDAPSTFDGSCAKGAMVYAPPASWSCPLATNAPFRRVPFPVLPPIESITPGVLNEYRCSNTVGVLAHFGEGVGREDGCIDG
jgi:hypothetical protein